MSEEKKVLALPANAEDEQNMLMLDNEIVGIQKNIEGHAAELAKWEATLKNRLWLKDQVVKALEK